MSEIQSVVGSIPTPPTKSFVLVPFKLNIMENNKIYEHDVEISPALRYCQPGLLIDLREFLKLLNKK